MKKFTLFVLLSGCSLAVFATGGIRTKTYAPRVYILMKKGKLIEVNHGHRKFVKKNIVLVNQTTIHPNGSIDVSSGQNLQLQEGEYITMDGKIRQLKDKTAGASAH